MWKQLINGLFFFFLIHIACAQEPLPNEIAHIKALLVKELSNGFPSLKVANGDIKLKLLNKKEATLYKLSEQPIDAFYLKSDVSSIFVASTSISGLRNGAYWYLHHLGYRYYFPNEIWSYIPKLETIYNPVEKLGIPSYYYRRIWYAYGTGSKKADIDYDHWFAANMLGGEEINAGHAYDGIVRRNKEDFLQHPEYFAQKVSKGTIPRNPKFEVANYNVVQLVIKDALKQIEESQIKVGTAPSMISMDPSDGGGFSTSSASLKIGGPSEQTFYLANEVAKAVSKKYPTVKVGLYAYNLHAAPPSFAIEPNIMVLVATAMNHSVYRTDELINLWKKKGITVGIRDYYGVMAWDWDMPGQPAGSRISYVKGLVDYYNKGVRLFSAETNIGWISRGLGHYIATRLLWNVNEDIERIKKEFFEQMFKLAAQEMATLYNEWENYRQPVPLEGDLYQWYKLVQSASDKEKDDAVQQRLNQVKQYLHYVYLFGQWKKSNLDEDLVSLLSYAYRVQEYGSVASYPLFRRLASSSVKDKKNMSFKDKEAVWKRNPQPLQADEIQKGFKKVMATLNTGAVTVNTSLPQNFKVSGQRIINIISPSINLRGSHLVVLQIQNPANALINIWVGKIKAYNYKSLIIKIYKYKGELELKADQLVLTKTLTPQKNFQSVSLSTLPAGTYLAQISDARSGFSINFSSNLSHGFLASSNETIWTLARNNFVFDVQKGIKAFAIYTSGVLTLKSPTGRVIDLQEKHDSQLKITIGKGEEGIWKVEKQNGRFGLGGITPLIATDEKMLIKEDTKTEKN